jgi:peptide/nickel transport system ATP-binding protein
MRAYPHQLSGGMKQRVMIASALSCSPQLLILDEPTTALDVTTEAAILDLLRALRAEYALSMIFISHNLDVVSRFCDDLCVLYAGSVVETGPVGDVFASPRHPYTKGLIAAVPKLGADHGRLPVIPGRLPSAGTRELACIFKPRCAFAEARCNEPQQLEPVESGGRVRCWKADILKDSAWPLPAFAAVSSSGHKSAEPILAVRGLSKAFELGSSLFLDQMPASLKRFLGASARQVRALNDVSIEVKRGEILGVLGESGSGKSTLARCIVGLIKPSAGEVTISPGNRMADARPKKQASIVQMVFQNPSSSLNPRRKVGEILDRPLVLSKYGNAQARSSRVRELLDLVRLPAAFAERYPRQLSGGERQRVGIARALAMSPDLIICDEALSALDVSVQAAVINLLLDLRAELGVAYLFISHDISVVGHIADRIAVMFGGAVVEEGSASEVLTGPSHPYTAELIRAASDHGSAPAREAPIAEQGCVFQFRCPSYMDGLCDRVAPQLRKVAAGLRIACHLENDRLPVVRSPRAAMGSPVQSHRQVSLSGGATA